MSCGLSAAASSLRISDESRHIRQKRIYERAKGDAKFQDAKKHAPSNEQPKKRTKRAERDVKASEKHGRHVRFVESAKKHDGLKPVHRVVDRIVHKFQEGQIRTVPDVTAATRPKYFHVLSAVYEHVDNLLDKMRTEPKKHLYVLPEGGGHQLIVCYANHFQSMQYLRELLRQAHNRLHSAATDALFLKKTGKEVTPFVLEHLQRQEEESTRAFVELHTPKELRSFQYPRDTIQKLTDTRDDLDQRKIESGESSADTLRCAHDLAKTYASIGDLDFASSLLRCVVKGYREKHASSSIDILESKVELARVLWRQGLDDGMKEAETLVKDALETYNASGDSPSAEMLVASRLLGKIYEARGQTANALSTHRATFEARKRLLGPAHASTMTSLGDIGLVERSEETLRKVLAFFESAWGYDNVRTIEYAAALGKMLRDQGRTKEAEPLFTRVAMAHQARLHGAVQ